MPRKLTAAILAVIMCAGIVGAAPPADAAAFSSRLHRLGSPAKTSSPPKPRSSGCADLPQILGGPSLHLRRVDTNMDADPLGTRSLARAKASNRSGDQEDDCRYGSAIRVHRPRVLEVGKRADINVIDHTNLRLREPRLVADLPAGGTRLLQAAEGYVATIVADQVTRENDEFTGARPGRLVRS